jgi:hypothetical protein
VADAEGDDDDLIRLTEEYAREARDSWSSWFCPATGGGGPGIGSGAGVAGAASRRIGVGGTSSSRKEAHSQEQDGEKGKSAAATAQSVTNSSAASLPPLGAAPVPPRKRGESAVSVLDDADLESLGGRY